MNSIFSRAVGVLCFATVALALAGNACAEKVTVKFTKNARTMHAESKMPVGNREIVRYFYLDTINASEGLELMEERGHDRDDQIDGTGTHSGTAADVLKDGNEIYQTFSGSHKTVAKPDGAWELTYEGVAIIKGGTGKYKNAKGQLKYVGRVTADSFHEADEGYIEY